MLILFFFNKEKTVSSMQNLFIVNIKDTRSSHRMCSVRFRKIHRKTPVRETFF